MSNFLQFYRTLPPQQKAGYFVWPSFQGAELLPAEQELVARFKPSGFIFFKRNLASISKARQLVGLVQTSCNKKCVLCIDEEGGTVSRLPPPFFKGLPAQQLASDVTLLREQILHQCIAAKSIGINCILAPVADILTEPKNKVIGSRSFGTDAETVSRCVEQAAKIFSAEGMLFAGKHFPGHGNTLADSHHEFATSHADLKTLLHREWVPFQTLIDAHTPIIMTAHVLLPKVDPIFPATFSSMLLQKYLRQQLGYKGLIVSDDLRMNAVAHFYNIKKQTITSAIDEKNTDILNSEDDSYLKKAAVDALQAGCDVLLSCQSIIREAKIFEAIADELEHNPDFAQLCEQKAVRINDAQSKATQNSLSPCH